MVCQSRRNGLLGIFHDELSHKLFMVYVKDLGGGGEISQTGKWGSKVRQDLKCRAIHPAKKP